VNCFIHIAVMLENERLKFTCDNSIIPGSKDNNYSTGVGLENIRKRLGLAYPGRHSLEIKVDRMAFRVKLQIDLE
jgi:LytS/YehU family sensor histidine kinase